MSMCPIRSLWPRVAGVSPSAAVSVLSTSAIAAALVSASIADEASDPVPWDEQGYLGLTVRALRSGHTAVSWVRPGPLDGEALTSRRFDLGRPDLLVSLDGRPVDADGFVDAIHALSPGEEITLVYRKALERGGTFPDSLHHADALDTLTVELGSRHDWEGTIGRAAPDAVSRAFTTPRLIDPDASSGSGDEVAAIVAEHGLGEAVDVLRKTFRDWWREHPDPHALSLVRVPFEDPFRLPDVARATAAPAELLTDPTPDTLVRWIGDLLDLPVPDPPLGPLVDHADDPAAIALGHILTRMEEAAALVRADLDHEALVTLVRNGQTLLRVPHETFYVGPDSARAALDAIHASLDLFAASGGSLPAYRALPAVLDAAIRAGDLDEALAALPPIPLPPELVGVVEGDLLYAESREGGWLVVGDEGANTYDLAGLDVVIDVGGDDTYEASDIVVGNRVVVDLAGDDRYTGTASQGPASAILGAVVVDDHAGDDRYEGELLSAGAALYGVAVLIDRDGADHYEGSLWSCGAAVYGAGVILDLGDANDAYHGDFLCQGVGGPRGLGAIVDAGGRDLYRANGPSESAYGTPAVYRSFSQGMGFGYRGYAAGGIGVIDDLGGDDRYEAGEFAQGGAYYLGFGLLHDRGGRDLYYGNRYGQGFGVHQAHGVLWDEGGDDTYWSMTAASQGAAWDIGAGLLLDEAGDDTYQCDGLGQGAASQQAIGMLVDLDGRDRYVAGSGAVQGRSGGNAYHFDDTGAYSLSILVDRGGDDDFYSAPGRANDTSASFGEANEEDPKASALHGVFVDR